jgi:hypothetical protein
LDIEHDGETIDMERIVQATPLQVTNVTYNLQTLTFSDTLTPAQHALQQIQTTTPALAGYGQHVALAQGNATTGNVLVLSNTLSTRTDAAIPAKTEAPLQQQVVVANTTTATTQTYPLPIGGQLVQTFWTTHSHFQANGISAPLSPHTLPYRSWYGGAASANANPKIQDEWMLEAHANNLRDGPSLPQIWYGSSSGGHNGTPHVSAAIMHGIAYVESDWHQFNDTNYQADGGTPGSPVESFDGGWGEYQQTSGMPPQCNSSNNCLSDYFQIQTDQSYNIGMGAESLIEKWNATAGVTGSDPNDPYKANDWFFAVWAYNGSYGNNPNDVSSSVYGQWYTGAPFRSIYEEYVWYFANHPQGNSNGWTDNFIPSLGSSALPPQSDFAGTDDSFVYCGTCTINDWTAGTYDNAWVGQGVSSQVAGEFTSAFISDGGEDTVGLPRDNGGTAFVHTWGNGQVQDFGGGSALPGILMLANGSSSIYWVHGDIWDRYYLSDSGATGCHGYPTSNQQSYSGPGNDSYVQQSFQTGSIIMDTTSHTMYQDNC